MIYSPSCALVIWAGIESVRKMIRKLGRWKRLIRLYVPVGGVCGFVMGVEGSSLLSHRVIERFRIQEEASSRGVIGIWIVGDDRSR